MEVYENWKKQRQRLIDLVRDVQAANGEDGPTDNRYLESVASENARYMVSGDAHVLRVDECQGI